MRERRSVVVEEGFTQEHEGAFGGGRYVSCHTEAKALQVMPKCIKLYSVAVCHV